LYVGGTFWTLDPSRNTIMPGAAVGTSGQGVFALGTSTAPTTFPIDTVQLWTSDFNGVAGSRGLLICDERGARLTFGSEATNASIVRLTDRTGTNSMDLYIDNVNNSGIGSLTNIPFAIWVNNAASGAQILLNIDANISMACAGNPTTRLIGTGAADSGGAGWRTLLIGN
jgi:hypothetical protein